MSLDDVVGGIDDDLWGDEDALAEMLVQEEEQKRKAAQAAEQSKPKEIEVADFGDFDDFINREDVPPKQKTPEPVSTPAAQPQQTKTPSAQPVSKQPTLDNGPLDSAKEEPINIDEIEADLMEDEESSGGEEVDYCECWPEHENGTKKQLPPKAQPKQNLPKKIFGRFKKSKATAEASFAWVKENKDPVDDFEWLVVLGQGSFGKVLKAKHKKTGNIVAVKCMKINLSKDDIIAKQDKMIELNVLHGCTDGALPCFYGSCVRNRTVWMLMEYCAGGTLDEYVPLFRTHTQLVGRHFKEGDLARIARDILLGLVYLHEEQKRFHGDLKSQNIMVSTVPQICCKIGDFGTCQLFYQEEKEKQVKAASRFVGTPAFAAPEMHDKTVCPGPRIDVWSLAITMISISELRMAYGGNDILELEEAAKVILDDSVPLPRLSRTEFDWSDEYHNFIEVCAKRNPMERPTARDALHHPWIKKVWGTPYSPHFVKLARIRLRNRKKKLMQEKRQGRDIASEFEEFIVADMLREANNK